MDIDEAQQRVLKLIRLAAGSPGEEGRTAASLACRLIAEHGLLVMKPADFIHMPVAPARPEIVPAPPTASIEKGDKKPKRKRASAKEIRETVTTVADTAATAINAAGRVVAAVNGFRNTVRGA